MSAAPPGADVLSAAVRALFDALTHAGDFGAASAVARGEAGREQHGTRVRFELHAPADGSLQVRYRAYGCPYTLATCEWLARELERRCARDGSAGGVARAVRGLGGPRQWAGQLDIPPERLGRLLIIEDALQVAVSALAAAGPDSAVTLS